MHVIERTDKFTLCRLGCAQGETHPLRGRGAPRAWRAEARRAPRERPGRGAQRTAGQCGGGADERLSALLRSRRRREPWPRGGADRDGVRPRPRRALLRRPGRDGADTATTGSTPRSPEPRRAARPGRRRLRRVPTRASRRPEAPLLNHLAVPRRLGGRPPEGGRGSRHRGAGLWTPGTRSRCSSGSWSACGSSTSSTSRRSRSSSVNIAGAGMAGLVAAARLRELAAEPVVYEKGTRAACRCCSRAGSPGATARGRSSRPVPRRRPGASAADPGAVRRRARLARGAGSRAAHARNREPAHGRRTLRSPAAGGHACEGHSSR